MGLLGATRARTEQSRTPWFTLWKKQFFQSVKFPNPPFELTNHPLAHIYFLSVEDPDPCATISAMRKAENVPV